MRGSKARGGVMQGVVKHAVLLYLLVSSLLATPKAALYSVKPNLAITGF